MSILLQNLQSLLSGLEVTIELILVGGFGGLVLGICIGIMRVAPLRVLRAAGTVYVEIIRNIPLLVLLVIFIFVLPVAGIVYPEFWTATTALAMYEGAYICEAIRSGVNTIPRGQLEACRSIGLTFGQSVRFVVLPQTLRTVVQPLGNIFIALAKDTSLVAGMGVTELTAMTDELNIKYARPIELFVAAGVAYIIIALIIGQTAGALERKIAARS